MLNFIHYFVAIDEYCFYKLTVENVIKPEYKLVSVLFDFLLLDMQLTLAEVILHHTHSIFYISPLLPTPNR